MVSRSYSFLDAAALPAIGKHFAAGEALVVLDAELVTVLWANGAGAKLFGADDLMSFIGSDAALRSQVRRQIQATSGFPKIGENRNLVLRIGGGLLGHTTTFSASHIEMPDGELAILLAAPANQARPGAAIDGLSGEGQFAALLDGQGNLVAAAPGFGDLGIGPSTLARIADDVRREADRLVKRRLPGNGGNLPAGAALLTDEPTLALLVVVAQDDADRDGTQQQAEPEEEPAPPTDIEEQVREPERQDAAVQPGPIAAAEVTEGWYFNGERPAEQASEPEAATLVPSVDPVPQVELSALPVRFVWRTDANGRFTSISDEFRAAFGEGAADVVGRRFADVSRVYGLDPTDEIAGLLARRDTWSGRSVMWPISGTDLKVPVDLAALPVYDRDRNFEGFRGFGVARMGDAVVDPEAIGLVLVPGTSPEPGAAPELVAPPEDPFRGEVPAIAITPTPERRDTDKVIRLAERRPAGVQRDLSAAEKLNFREIGEKLRLSGMEAERAAAALAIEEAAGGGGEETQPADPAGDMVTTAAETGSQEPDSANELEPAGEKPQHAAEFLEPALEARPEPMESAEPVGAAVTKAATEPLIDLGAYAASSYDLTSTEEAAPLPHAVQDAPQADEPPKDEPPTDEPNVLPQGWFAIETATEAEPEETSPAEDASAAEANLASTEITAPDTEEPLADEPSAVAADAPPVTSSPGVDTAVLSRLPLPIIVHAGDELYFANDEFLHVTGYASVAELDAAGGLGALFGEPYAAGDTDERKLRLRTRAGAELPVDAFLQSIAWSGGKALLLSLRVVPSSPTGAAAEPAASVADERLEELRTIIDTATDGVVLIENDGTIRSISHPAEALFGFDAAEVRGKPFSTLFAIESQRAARDYLASLADNGVASVLNDGREVIGREAQGGFIPLFMTIGRLPRESGYCAVVRDITQFKRAEEELTQARAHAERASSTKTDFLARVSHEIRTPLNAIIGFSELMLDEKFGPITNERYKDYLRDINRSGNHVLDLVNDLLDISKIEAGQLELNYEAVSLNEALSDAVAMMQPQANRERVIIRSSFASKLPEVVADLRSIRQIALNLLSNAIRYTPAGGQVIVSTSYEPAGDILMRVRDTGIGMAAAEIEQALKPFKQINALKRPRGDGTGLGLPLTKAMVEANRARFAISSTPGEGTLVEITFPSTRVLAH